MALVFGNTEDKSFKKVEKEIQNLPHHKLS
jgi:hypothetical protein